MLNNLIPNHVASAMFRRKPLVFEVESLSPQDSECSANRKGEANKQVVGLRRTLNLLDLILYGVGCSVGAGIYCLVGIGAEIAGPAIALSFLLCGAACVFTSLCYAEFAARIPVTGSAYVYAYVTFGEFMGWLVGWLLTLNYAFSASVVARSWAEYLASFVRGLPIFENNGVELMWLTRLHLTPVFWFIPHSYSCSPLSIVIIVLCTLVLVTGAKESSRFNNAMTVLNLSMLAFVIFAGLGSGTVEGDNLMPFFPQGMSGVLQGSGLVFFAFIGFDMVACLSEEVKNPERNMPLGIVGTLGATTAIYVAVTLVVIGMAPFHLLGGDVPIVNALLSNGCCTHEQQLADVAGAECLSQTCSPMVFPVLRYGSKLVSFGAIFGLTTGTFTSLMGQPRIFYRMAMDGLLFNVFAQVNEETQVPTQGIILTGVLCSLLSCFVDLEALANLISLGTLAVFTFVNAGVILLRMRPTIIDSHTSISVDNLRAAAVDGDEEEEDDDFPSSDPPNVGPVTEGSGAGGGESTLEMLLSMYQGYTYGTVANNGSKPALFTILFTASSVMASMGYNNDWGRPLSLVCVTLASFSVFVLISLPKSKPPETFQCPFVPAVPLLGLGCNGYMMGSLPLGSWVFLFLWLGLGLAIYFLYGIKHSALGHPSLFSGGGTDNESLTEYSPLCSANPSSAQARRYDASPDISLSHFPHHHKT